MQLSRRDFLSTAACATTAVSIGTVMPSFLEQGALEASTKRHGGDTILVVVQLAGGNDVDTVVPHRHDAYTRNRTTLRLPGKRLLPIDSDLGFHPALDGFMRLLERGELSVLQGVGYPNPSGDHNRAMKDWHTAMPNALNCQTGWLGRAIDGIQAAGGTMPGIFLGSIKQPMSLAAREAIVPSIASPEELILHAGPGLEGTRRPEAAGKLPRTPDESGQNGPDNDLLEHIRDRTDAALETSTRVRKVLDLSPGKGQGSYPQFQLASRLAAIARLIRADIGIRIFHTELGGEGPGGFDNHANQRDNHAALLRQLAASVAAFIDDLRQHRVLDRVLLVTFSEFGRTLKENGRHGTGHGSAAPMFLAGGSIRGGLVGPHPSLTELENGGPRHHTDFRRVYATALESWLGIESEKALGGRYEPLDVFEGRFPPR